MTKIKICSFYNKKFIRTLNNVPIKNVNCENSLGIKKQNKIQILVFYSKITNFCAITKHTTKLD